MNIERIKAAKTTFELNAALESELNAIGCELDASHTYEESRDWFAQDGENGCHRAVKILDAAIERWYEIEA